MTYFHHIAMNHFFKIYYMSNCFLKVMGTYPIEVFWLGLHSQSEVIYGRISCLSIITVLKLLSNRFNYQWILSARHASMFRPTWFIYVVKLCRWLFISTFVESLAFREVAKKLKSCGVIQPVVTQVCLSHLLKLHPPAYKFPRGSSVEHLMKKCQVFWLLDGANLPLYLPSEPFEIQEDI